ncbi:nucleotidyltransferase family protein [Sporosarcina sp. ANT_H38]|uniref:nucleotidyltransferase family protein n=1 Tax=Sporosarcina sp. ANT_H38 TaxID=2597358 RepID=UPI0011F388BA|nr:nucleotidyltransferase family protein [Sporosarcina sp. ANT_H38]KAA0964947.1 nucleotidyltransferase family protein [Sporosarcina sp. ANT_H38]
MIINNEEDIISSIGEDKWMMGLLKCAQSLNLPDWWICAGFVRSKIWDVQHGFDERTTIPDIDVIYYDRINIEKSVEKEYEEALKRLLPTIPWSVKNQARMHSINKISPYSSSVDAISKFPETATALGVKLDGRDNVILTAPHGIDDVVNFIVKPTPYFCEQKEQMKIYKERIRKKNWQVLWNKIEIISAQRN